MNKRSLVFENFRNLGILDSADSSNTNFIMPKGLSSRLQLGSIDKEHIGGLLVLLGGNNDGKSNVLEGFKRLADSSLQEDDKPDYRNFKGEPKLTLEYKIVDENIAKILNTESKTKSSEKAEITNSAFENFKGKTFGIFFTDGSLEKGVEYEACKTAEEYCQMIEDLLADSKICAVYGYDEREGRKEIRLILPEHNRMLLCSPDQGGKALKCFSSVEKKYDEVKDKERAIKLLCNFRVAIKAPKDCSNANELRAFLKSEFEKTQNVISNTANTATITPPPRNIFLRQY